MSKNYFDLHGWLSASPIEGRETDVAPPDTPAPDGMGWNFSGYSWVLCPLAPPVVPVEKPARRIAVGSFFDRFGSSKYQILADSNPAVQALIKDCSVRRFIDLDRADLPSGLQMLVQAGHQIDPAAIVSAPVLPEESPT